MNTIKITTINVRGLSSLTKKKYLWDFLKDHKIDIACLQEISNPFEDFPDTNYSYILNKGPHLGTAIVYKTHLKPIETQKDLGGRIIKIFFKDFNIINIYGYPAGTQYNTEKRNRLFTLANL